MAYDAEKFDLGSSRDHAPTTCAATRDPIARAAPVDPKTLTTPRERLEYLRDFLRGLATERFSMDTWVCVDPECGTVACIGGWTCQLFGRPADARSDNFAQWALGLSEDVSGHLFVPEGWRDPDFATPAQAADVLDHLIATGEVRWDLARSEA
jgi:hypothetical protein